MHQGRELLVRMTRGFGFAAAVGVVSGIFTVLFLGVIHTGEEWLWHILPETFHLPYITAAVALLCALGVGVLRARTPTLAVGMEEEFNQTGAVSPKTFPQTLALSLLSLFSGASIGPEGPLSHLSAQLATFTSGVLRAGAVLGHVLVFGGVAAAFSAFLGSPLIGTFLALEMFHYKKYDYDSWVLPSLVAGGVSFAVYWALTGGGSVQLFAFPGAATLSDMWWALPLGVCGALVGVGVGVVFTSCTQVASLWTRTHPILLSLVGGLAIALAALFLPILLFSGQEEMLFLFVYPPEAGVWPLLVLVVGKALLTAVCFASGFKGGPIFPLLFIGTAAGVLVLVLFPVLPAAVAVLATATGLLVASMRLPLSAMVLMTLLSGVVWMPVIIMAAITGYAVLLLVSPAGAREALVRLVPA